MGFFDWFKKKKDSKHLTLKSNEFPWPKDIPTNHARGKKHWQNFYCLGSNKEALKIYTPKETKKRLGACSSCGKESRVTGNDTAFRHLPVSVGS